MAEKSKSTEHKKHLHDLIFAAVCLFAAALIWLGVTLYKKPGAVAVVTVDGKAYGSYPLAVDDEIDISTERGDNTLVIKDGKAGMRDADCPDKLCVKQHSIDETGESIVCLPHKLVVTVESGGDSGVDLTA